MAAVSNIGASCGCQRRRGSGEAPAIPNLNRRATIRVPSRTQDDRYCIGGLCSSNFRLKYSTSHQSFCIRMALVDKRVIFQPEVAKTNEVLAYHLVQGDLTTVNKSTADTPTAVLLHGILGGRKNWGSFAKRLAQEFPTWQFLLVDLHVSSHQLLRHPLRRLPSLSRPSLSVKFLQTPLRIRLRSSSSTAMATSAAAASAVTAAKDDGTAASKRKQFLQVFENEEELSASLAKYTAELSEKFASERGAFTVVVSGGSLIKSLRKLAESPFVDSIDWSKWHVFWVDERVVPKDHPDSNYKLAYDGLLSKVPIPPGHVYAINDALSAEGAADDYESCLKQLVKSGVVAFSETTGFPKFDVMLLGMGPDGHVASLFPGHPLLSEHEHWVTFVTDSPKPPPERITFTLPVINSSAYVALVVTGSGKAGVVSQALGGEHSSGDLLPVQMVKLEEGELSWFADKAAVSKLQDKASL